MEVDGVKQKYNPKTLKDEHGQYPVWMNQRAVKKQRGLNKKGKKGKRKSGR